MADKIFGIDEKPVRMNEAGSKNVRTLEIVGAPAVSLKESVFKRAVQLIN